jgi:hypothetical protein
MATDRVPTNEIGSVLDRNLWPYAYGNDGNVIVTPPDEAEYATAWMWPNSIWTVDRMRNNVQLDSLIDNFFGPIEGWRWAITQGEATRASAERIAEDLGLPLVDADGFDTITEPDTTFDHADHLHHALLAPLYGHYFFEQVGAVIDGYARLRKLAPRPPRTISDIGVDEDGSLEWIKQSGIDPPPIPIGRLVAFTWQKEAGNWFGRSILRSCYGPWQAQDRLIRDDLTKNRRNATGMPIVEMGPDPTDAQIKQGEQLVADYRSADKGGGLLPAGWKLALQGVSGSTSDPIESARYHDEKMTMRFAQMVMNLGTSSSGNRALGETFDDILERAQGRVARWYQNVMQQHVIEDFTRWNDGPDAPAPRLVFDAHPEPDVDAIQLAIKDGAIQVDDAVENAIRKALKLPPIDPATVRRPVVDPAAVIDPATGNPAAPMPPRRARVGAPAPTPQAPAGV